MYGAGRGIHRVAFMEEQKAGRDQYRLNRCRYALFKTAIALGLGLRLAINLH